MAEILKIYFPKHVELHNFVPSTNTKEKQSNWSTLNSQVIRKDP